MIAIGGEVEERLDLCGDRNLRFQDARQKLDARLDATLRPAALLRLERIHFHRNLARCHDVRQEDEAPAQELRAITEVEILGQRVVLPAARRLDRGAAPHAGSPIEVEEPTRPASTAMLEDEMPIELDRLDLGQQ